MSEIILQTSSLWEIPLLAHRLYFTHCYKTKTALNSNKTDTKKAGFQGQVQNRFACLHNRRVAHKGPSHLITEDVDQQSRDCVESRGSYCSHNRSQTCLFHRQPCTEVSGARGSFSFDVSTTHVKGQVLSIECGASSISSVRYQQVWPYYTTRKIFLSEGIFKSHSKDTRREEFPVVWFTLSSNKQSLD